MSIKSLSSFLTASVLLMGAFSIASAQTVMSSSTETYLGAVAYPGGLMERQGLRLNTLTDLRYIRVEVPSFCNGDVFEVGFVSNGAYLTAEKLRDNLYAINGGRGMLSDGIYLSINGPQSNGCSVLVFKVDSNTPTPVPPQPSQEYAYVCLSNATRANIPTNVSSPSGTTQGIVYSGQTVIISQPTLPNRVIPSLSISYDADLSLGYLPMALNVASTVMPVGNCQYAPLYQYVEDAVLRRINVVRLH